MNKPSPTSGEARNGLANAAYERRQAPGPQIYVASLSDYNNARLHGTWIDATDEPDSIRSAITDMLDQSDDPAAEEYAIHDYSGFAGYAVGEYDDIDTLHTIACGIAEYGEAFSVYVSLAGTESVTESDFLDSFHGTYATFRDFADGYLDELGWDDALERLGRRTGLAQFIAFDYDAFESTIRSEWSVADGHDGVHIFAP